MSTSISVYAVPLDQLTRVLGSRDRPLADAVAGKMSGWFARIDKLADPDPDPDEPPVPTCSEALHRIIEGDLADVPGFHGYVYGYAFEALCAYLGEELEGISAIAGSSEWIETIDRWLDEAGVPLRLQDLVFGPGPVILPEPDDYPMIGHWPPEVIARSLGPIREVDLEGADFETDGTVRQIRDWVEFAAARPGTGLIGCLS
ncbi:DUF7691 family protein [Tundrisphaera lichenicola]|uniref:DUF7691 family protein n=1 Tax=Tundrisphaera lichenicola TaxID=2029860 RepID=UPI003EB941FD